LVLNNIHGIIDHISNILAKKNIKNIFERFKTLKHLFRIVKDKSNLMLGQVNFQILRSYGKSHIGQNGMSFKSRLNEH
jgi:hypothetical protein